MNKTISRVALLALTTLLIGCGSVEAVAPDSGTAGQITRAETGSAGVPGAGVSGTAGADAGAAETTGAAGAGAAETTGAAGAGAAGISGTPYTCPTDPTQTDPAQCCLHPCKHPAGTPTTCVADPAQCCYYRDASGVCQVSGTSGAAGSSGTSGAAGSSGLAPLPGTPCQADNQCATGICCLAGGKNQVYGWRCAEVNYTNCVASAALNSGAGAVAALCNSIADCKKFFPNAPYNACSGTRIPETGETAWVCLESAP